MFGVSLQKILFTILAIGVVWYGFKWFGRRRAGRPADDLPRKARHGTMHKTKESVEDMVKCSTCNDYVSGQIRSCGRPGCPFP